MSLHPPPPPPPIRRRFPDALALLRCCASASSPRAPPHIHLQPLLPRAVRLTRYCTRCPTAPQGYISSEEFLGIPELSINPLSQRLVALFENTNFQDFVKKVSLFSDKAPFEEKLRFMFQLWDVDGDGRVSLEDLEHVLRQRAGSSLGEGELRAVAERVLRESGVGVGGSMGLEHFRRVFEGDGLAGMRIDPPQLSITGFIM